jgi:quinol monooxygenase YgiN
LRHLIERNGLKEVTSVPADLITAALFTRFRTRREHTFGEKMPSTMRLSHEILGGVRRLCPRHVTVLSDAQCLQQQEKVMSKFALYVPLEAKPGKEKEVADFLRSAVPLVNAEPGTISWFAIQMGPSSYAIFDTFDTEAGRDAHLRGKVAAALTERRRVAICLQNRWRFTSLKSSRTSFRNDSPMTCLLPLPPDHRINGGDDCLRC